MIANFVRRSSKTVTSSSSDSASLSTSNTIGGPNGASVSNSSSNCRLDADPEIRLEEKLRRKAFAHYDVQSISANLSSATKLVSLISKRTNTTTGASAASAQSTKLSTQGSNEDGISDNINTDDGDNRSNDLLLSCPFFRNELGGEEERIVSLNRMTSLLGKSQAGAPLLHRPSSAVGLSLLEAANDTRWKIKSCPYLVTQDKSFVIENHDSGAQYYRDHFHQLDHQNWFGIDDNLGPIAVSIRKEKINLPAHLINIPSDANSHHHHLLSSSSSSSGSHSLPGHYNNNGHLSSSSSSQNTITAMSTTTPKHQYRIIIRTSELSVLRGTVYEEVIPGLSNYSNNSRHNSSSNHHAKEVLEYIAPELSTSCLRLGTPNSEEQLIKLDEQTITKTYKVGVLYCKKDQSTEEEMYNNEYSSRAFDEFLTMLGEKVRLKGFTKYRAGLDNKTDTTGSHCIYTTYNDVEITFHVSTLLPFTPNNRQQLLRKRHVGNDIVTIIFQEPEAKPFTPKTIRSHFQHVFIIVRLVNTPPGAPIQYQVAVSRSKEVPVFGPPIVNDGMYTKSNSFTEFILSKIINAENAAHTSDKFKSMAQRTRHEYLKDLAENYVTSVTINELFTGPSAGAKLVSSIFGGKNKSRSRNGQFRGDSIIQGAIVWDVQVDDYGADQKPVDCLLGISSDTFVLIQESTKEIIFVTPNFSILGWSSTPSSITVFYHQGECVFIKCKDADLDEIAEIVSRLKSVTNGAETQTLLLRRNSLGQLGFHFIQEGIITDVEPYAFAWQAGLRPHFRIVEICTVAIATLDHEGIKDLLKTSMNVSVTVLPPKSDLSPRRGCPLPNCSYLTLLMNGTPPMRDYENISGIFERTTLLGSDRRRKHRDGSNHGHGGSIKVISSRSSSDQSSTTSRPWNGSKSQPVSPEHHRYIVRTESDAIKSPTMSNNAPSHQMCPSTSSSPLNSWSHEMSYPRAAIVSNGGISRDGKMCLPGSNLVAWHSELSLSSKALTSSNTSLHKDEPSTSFRDRFVTGRDRFHDHPHAPQAPPQHVHHQPQYPTLNGRLPMYPSSEARPSSGFQPVHQLRTQSHPQPPPPPTANWNTTPKTGNSSTVTRIGPSRTNGASSVGPMTGSLERQTQEMNGARTKSPSSRTMYNFRAAPIGGTSSSARHVRERSTTKSSGSSCSGSSSTLQEDLLKLISPDYNCDEAAAASSSRTRNETETIFTMAQPAHVVSSEPSTSVDNSPESCSSKSGSRLPVVVESGNDEWSTLVDTATKAIAQGHDQGHHLDSKSDLSSSPDLDESLSWLDEFKKDSAKSTCNTIITNPGKGKSKSPEVMSDGASSATSNVNCNNLEETVERLQVTNATLEEELNKLREENQRLQEESQTATAQLRKFSEWFFQNINAK